MRSFEKSLFVLNALSEYALFSSLLLSIRAYYFEWQFYNNRSFVELRDDSDTFSAALCKTMPQFTLRRIAWPQRPWKIQTKKAALNNDAMTLMKKSQWNAIAQY